MAKAAHVCCVCVLLQQQYGYQEEEERSLNSLDDNPAFPLHPSSYRSRSRGSPLDRDRQLLQDLVSFYLTSPSSSSSSSSSPVQSLPRHRGAAAAAAGLPSSLSSSSSSSFFPELDFPLDYGEDYVSQVAQQEPAEKKAQDEYDALSGLDGERDDCLFFVYSFFLLCVFVCLSAHFLLFFFLFQLDVCKFLQTWLFFVSVVSLCLFSVTFYCLFKDIVCTIFLLYICFVVSFPSLVFSLTCLCVWFFVAVLDLCLFGFFICNFVTFHRVSFVSLWHFCHNCYTFITILYLFFTIVGNF